MITKKDIMRNLTNFDIFLGTLSETISLYIPLACLIQLVMNTIPNLYTMPLVYVIAFMLYYIIALMHDDHFNSTCIKEGKLVRTFFAKYI